MNAYTSTPVRASMACIMPSLPPTQISERRLLCASINPGYSASGGGSIDGGSMKAGVDPMNGPSDCDRTYVMMRAASDSVTFMYGASVATFAVVRALTVPSGVTVKMLRVAAAGADATYSFVPSCTNLYVVGVDCPPTGL